MSCPSIELPRPRVPVGSLDAASGAGIEKAAPSPTPLAAWVTGDASGWWGASRAWGCSHLGWDSAPSPPPAWVTGGGGWGASRVWGCSHLGCDSAPSPPPAWVTGDGGRDESRAWGCGDLGWGLEACHHTHTPVQVNDLEASTLDKCHAGVTLYYGREPDRRVGTAGRVGAEGSCVDTTTDQQVANDAMLLNHQRLQAAVCLRNMFRRDRRSQRHQHASGLGGHGWLEFRVRPASNTQYTARTWASSSNLCSILPSWRWRSSTTRVDAGTAACTTHSKGEGARVVATKSCWTYRAVYGRPGPESEAGTKQPEAQRRGPHPFLSLLA